MIDRIVEIRDSQIIKAVVNKSFMTVAQAYNFTKENAPGFPAFVNEKRIDDQLKNGLKMYAYEMNEKIIACVGYSCNKDSVFLIERLATWPEYRHLGIGKKMMKFIETQIIENSGKTAEVHIVDKNTVLKEWYKKIGYKEIRIEAPPSLPFKVCIMQKDLA